MTAEQRVQPIDIARGVISHDRNDAYGAPEDNFAVIADLWSVYLNRKGRLREGAVLTTHDISVLMVLLKIGRITTGVPGVLDNFTDGIGYLAIAWEQQVRELERATDPVETDASEPARRRTK